MSFLSEAESAVTGVASSVASVASAGTPILGAVTGVAAAITQSGKVAETLITSEQQTAALTRRQQTIQRYDELIDRDAAGDAAAPAELCAFFNGLLERHGVAVGPLSGRYVRLPVEHVTGFVTDSANGEQAADLLNGIEHTLTASGKASA
jgi:hypothetical protein